LTIKKAKHILVAPLDWGMGHTTRCIPIIKYLMQNGYEISFAGNEWQRRYITDTFNGLATLHLDGYDVHYSRSGKGFKLSLFSQLPKLVRTIKKEHNWLKKAVDKYKINVIISDNRYGLFHPNVPCVIMTHQLLAQTNMGSAADNLLMKFHYKYLERFNKCWAIDVEGTPNLSGRLAHPNVLPANCDYIGMLSQMEEAGISSTEHLLILLSGPEPQRTILSELLWQQALDHKGKIVFVEGSDAKPHTAVPSHITHYGRLTKDVLQPLIEKAELVICRSGYSTLMDLAVLNKKAIIIPTPGQTEQEYLGNHLHNEGVFYSAAQKNFSLSEALNNVKQFPFVSLSLDKSDQRYKQVVDKWLLSI
jgi:UDP-N-acetylglucosamine transferase subunit ALG13